MTMNQLDNRKIFNSLIKYLWKYPADFCLVYHNAKSWGRSLNLRGAFSYRYKSQHDGEKSGEQYYLLADDRYRQSRDMIIEELVDPSSNAWISVSAWKARILKALKIRTPTPANSNGQRWWQIIVASGPTRKAGYAIVTRVAVRDVTELRQCIEGIQKIMRGELPPAEGEPRRV